MRKIDYDNIVAKRTHITRRQGSVAKVKAVSKPVSPSSSIMSEHNLKVKPKKRRII